MAINFIHRVNRLSPGLSESAKVDIMDRHLKLNDYPKSLRHRLINRRNSKTSSSTQHNTIEQPDLQHTYRSMAYIPYLTEKISKLLKNEYRTVKLATRNTNIAKKYYTQTKDKVAKDDHYNVIYSIPCNDCRSQYIGMTTNKLKTRISGHKSNINMLEKLYSTDTNIDDSQFTTLCEKTALLNHCIKNKHTFNLHDAKILDQHRNTTALPILEICHIATNDNTVNKRSDTDGLSSIYAGLFRTTINNNKQHEKHKRQQRSTNCTNLPEELLDET